MKRIYNKYLIKNKIYKINVYKSFFFVFFSLFFPLIFIGQNIESQIQGAFPNPDSNNKQVYINLPQINNEANYLIQVFVGRYALLNCDNLILKGELQESNLQGYNFPFYTVKFDSLTRDSKMMCIEDEYKKFFHITPKFLKYNSQFPLVFYIPNNFTVRYKVYNADNALFSATNINFGKKRLDQQYHFLEHYYVKKGAQVPSNNYIENEKELESVYWFSRTNYNIPTKINFDNEFVVPIIFKDSYYQNKIEIVSVEKDDNGFIQIFYKIRYGKQSSYPIYPSIGIVLSNKFKGRVFVNELK